MKKQKKDDAQKEHKKPWREVYATVEDIQNFLMDRVLLRHNVITTTIHIQMIRIVSEKSLLRTCAHIRTHESFP